MPKSSAQRVAASRHKEFVGRQLMLAREAAGITQAQMARDYGIGSNRLNQWEKGLYYPDPWFLKNVADDWGFTMDYFYRGARGGVSAERAADLRRAASGKKAG